MELWMIAALIILIAGYFLWRALQRNAAVASQRERDKYESAPLPPLKLGLDSALDTDGARPTFQPKPRREGARIGLRERDNEENFQRLLAGVVPPVFVAVDLETTGLDPTYDKIIEIGALRVNREGGILAEFSQLIKNDLDIPSEIVTITGITNELIDTYGESISDAFVKFSQFIGDSPLVCYNARFDMAFLRSAAAQLNLPFQHWAEDALALSREAFPNLSRYRLTDVATARGISTSGAHRALGDCHMTASIYMQAATAVARARLRTGGVRAEHEIASQSLEFLTRGVGWRGCHSSPAGLRSMEDRSLK